MIMRKDIIGNGMQNRLTGWPFYLVLVAGLIWLGNAPIQAQDTPADTTMVADTTAQANTEAEAAPEEETIKSKTSLTADQYPDNSIVLKGLLRAKIEGSYQKVPGRKVAFFSVNAEGEETALGDTLTGPDGIASIRIQKANLAKSEDGSFSLLARYDGDDKMDGSESDLMLRPATLVMEAKEADSTYTLSLQATAESADGPVPIAAAPVSVYVKRMFSSLKVAEGETDESGMIELEFPAGLAGDEEGNLQITAMIEETEEYGNLTASSTQKWGYSVSKAPAEMQRALWSPHPPTWMVITFFILMGAVWIHYAIVIVNLFRLKAQGPHTTNKS
jgi:hypothetical protein